MASVMVRYDKVVGWRTIIHWERMDTWMEWGEGVSSRSASSMVRTQLSKKKKGVNILVDLNNQTMRHAFHSVD